MAGRTVKILGVCGSLRKQSYNLWTMMAAAKLVPPNVQLTMLPQSVIAALPLFNQDDEKKPNDKVKQWKDAIQSHDCILFCTPEYNHSIPGVLKNAIDIASRPVGQSAFKGKTAGIMSASGGMLGGVRSQVALRLSIQSLEMQTPASPEILIPLAQNKFDASGELTDENTKKFMAQYLQNLADLTLKLRGSPDRSKL